MGRFYPSDRAPGIFDMLRDVESRDGPQTPFEVYCYGCQASFAVGTRSCVHCGGRLASKEGTSAIETALGGADGVRPSGEVEADESPVVGIVRRLSGASLWVVFVLFAMLARMCEGQ